MSSGVHFIHADFQKETLYFISLSGVEELGRPFCYEVEFCCELDKTLDPNKFLGQKLSVEIKGDEGQKSRFFHGVVRFFQQQGRYARYRKFRVELVPSFWLLTQKSDCRIFQNKTVVEIVNEVMSNDKPKANLAGQYPKIDYCTQYRESDFDFVSRLLESEGIYYFFKHEKAKHEMYLVDSNQKAESFEGGPEIKYRRTVEATNVNHISGWRHDHQIRSGQFKLKDYDFEKPDVLLEAQSKVKLDYSHSDLAVFDYPGRYVETKRGETLAKVRLNEILVEQEQVEAISTCHGLSVGSFFKLTEHPEKSENIDYLTLKTQIDIESAELEPFGKSGNTFQTELWAIPKQKKEFHPRRTTPKPYVRGPQTALVVGKKGEEIWTDKHGRVKVQFHWDREGKKDENSSCWVRVSQAWAGKNWGAIQLPRIGQEVIVEFLEGDPDQPIVTGRVYNENMPVPYKLPDNQTQSGILSRSSKSGNTETFNELRFEDKKDAEEIYFHAEKDFHRVVENNDTLEVGLDKKDKGNQTVTIHNDRTVTIKEGNDMLTIEKGDHTTKVDAGKVLIKAAKEITLQVGSSKIIIKPGSIDVTSAEVKIEGSLNADVKAVNTTIEGSGMTIVKGGLIKLN